MLQEGSPSFWTTGHGNTNVNAWGKDRSFQSVSARENHHVRTSSPVAGHQRLSRPRAALSGGRGAQHARSWHRKRRRLSRRYIHAARKREERRRGGGGVVGASERTSERARERERERAEWRQNKFELEGTREGGRE